jgi:deoxycytidine triphosphate deaminase
MSRELIEAELKAAIESNQLILNGQTKSVEGLKYDFTLGSRILFGGRQPIDVNELAETERSELSLKPGELVYVLTSEELDVPEDVKAELSPKRKISHDGVLVLGGFCVDPGYKGRLMLALYNLSTTPFPLQAGKKLIAAQFYKLDKDETPPASKSEALHDFPPELVRWMGAYKPTSTEGLSQQVSDLAKSLETLRREVQSKEDWFDRFQKSLDQITHNVASLTEGLKNEADSRREAEKEMRRDILGLQTGTATNNALLLAGTAIVAAIVGGLIVFVLSKLIH